jgi:hypothetical protein
MCLCTDNSLFAFTERHVKSLLTIAKCHYATKKYSLCERFCAKMPHSHEACLLKGKALYHMYQKKQRWLRQHQKALEPRQFFTQHKACYEMAKEVVNIFRRAKNSNHSGMDSNCSQMLDFAILDYILETNKLKDLKLCFLCLKRPGADFSPQVKDQVTENPILESKQHEPMEGGADVASVKHKRIPRENFRFSHLIPYGVIKYFMKNADIAPGSKNVLFGVSGTKLGSTARRTPGTAAVYMLCPSCEHNLNICGEQAFMSFLETVYNPLYSDTEITHVYGKEMFHFCIGLIFRTLCPSQDECINCDEVYQLLVQCRGFLTSDSRCDNIPDVFMFVCPSEDDEYDKEYHTFITQHSVSYTASIALDCHLERLHTFTSVLANFFMVKVGTIIVVAKFDPAKELIDKRFQINPEAGSYSIPANKARRALIPPGIWTALHVLYKSSEADCKVD